jgi:hypothetical protein
MGILKHLMGLSSFLVGSIDMTNATLAQATKLISTITKHQREADSIKAMKQIIAADATTEFFIMFEGGKALIPKARVNNILNDVLDKYTALIASSQAEFDAL